MISIKKYLDMAVHPSESRPVESSPDPVLKASASKPASTDLTDELVKSYRSTVLSIANNGARACPAVSADLQPALTGLLASFDKKLSSVQVQQTGKQIADQLDSWGGRAAEYFKSKTAEVKELLISLARTAESMVARDQSHSQRLKQFTRELQAIANLEDLGQIRSSLVRQATELKTCVDRIEEDNQRAISELKTEVVVYETRLRKAETLASIDELTGLLNRRSLERRIESAMDSGRPFCIAVLDLNGFKQINDTHGHTVGDRLLKQFAEELRTNIRTSDIAGRWGGDEFILLLDCEAAVAKTQVERLEKWAFGDYTLGEEAGRAALKLSIHASVGLAQWKAGETMAQLIDRADQNMYREKKLARGQNA